jgi:hypothetical protein
MKQFHRFSSRGGFARFQTLLSAGRKIASDIVNREIKASEGHIPEGKDIMSNLGICLAFLMSRDN